MNLKYYLRGLGIGILVTALIMSIAAGGKETLSNEEIKERAKALGMVEEGTLLQNAQAGSDTLEKSKSNEGAGAEEPQNPVESGTPEETPQPEETDASEETPQPEEADASEEMSQADKTPEPEEIREQENASAPDEFEANEEETAEETQKPEDPSQQSDIVAPTEEDLSGSDESVTIQVQRGDGSYTVCKRLEEAGLISSASEFDTFLYQNGYDKRIRAGTFEIPAGAAPEQIARILSGI